MSRHFIIADPSDELYLMLSQYLSMGWIDAEIEESSLGVLLESRDINADAILLSHTDPDNPDIQSLLKSSAAGEMPPIILLHNDDIDIKEEISVTTPVLNLEDLTPLMLNGAIAEAMKGHIDSGGTHTSPESKTVRKHERADNELPGEHIDGLRGYRLIKEIGRGGMSRVYLARDKRDNKEVAIKVLSIEMMEDERMIERFIREYTILSSVDSPHVARIIDQTFTDNHVFIIMEYFKGGDLTRRIRKGMAPEDALEYLRQLAIGLDAVHRRGIVHRDLKPGNILFRPDDTLAILDFGLAQFDDGGDLTRHGEVYGTPSYVSPEQARGKRVDHRSDIYSSGIIFYQMLAQKKPYRADNPLAMFYKHIHAQTPQLPEPFQRYQPLLEKMMAKFPDERFQDARELLDAVIEYQEE